MRKCGTRGQNRIERQGQRSKRLQHGYRRYEFHLSRRLVAQVAVGTLRVVAGNLMIPVADDAGGEDQQHDQRQ